jgi:hypothetical protein
LNLLGNPTPMLAKTRTLGQRACATTFRTDNLAAPPVLCSRTTDRVASRVSATSARLAAVFNAAANLHL